MSRKIETLKGWNDARDSFVAALSSTFALLQHTQFSDSPNSTYQRAHAEAQRILDQLRVMSLIGLREIDLQIAGSNIVAQLDESSRQVKDAAEELANMSATITRISKLVDDVSQIVSRFIALPFV